MLLGEGAKGRNPTPSPNPLVLEKLWLGRGTDVPGPSHRLKGGWVGSLRGGRGTHRSPGPPFKYALLQLAFEHRRALFQEGRHALLGVGAGEAQGEQVDFQGAAGAQVNVGTPVHRLFGGP